MISVLKQPTELVREPLPFANVATIVSTQVEPRGLVAEVTPIAVTAELAAGAVTVSIGDGTDGERYLVTVVVELVSGETREAEIEATVINGTWTMPAGGAGYLSIAEFVDQFGLDEVVRMTDSGDGRIDRAYLVTALRAAQGEVDLNLSARYAVPLTGTIPDVIKTAVGDIARIRLYPRGAPDGVADAVKSARAMLLRIADGKLPLPLPAGEAPAAAESDAPIVFHSGGRAYPGGLADY